MSLWKKMLIAFALLLVIFIGTCVWFYWRHPIAVTRMLGRGALKQAGFVQTTLDTPVGKMAVWEAGSGPPLVLLHGAGDYAGAWALVAPNFTQSYRVIIPDLPGHGDSEPRSGPLKLSDVLRGAESVVAQRRDGKPVILAGNSMGGWLALLYAQRHPGDVARVVSINGGGIRAAHNVSLTPNTREEARNLLAMLQDSGSPTPPDNVLDDIVRTSHEGAIGRLMLEYADMEQLLLENRLGEISTPVELLWGASDKFLDLDFARRLEAGLPASRLTTLPRCGHVALRECPAALTREMKRLLQEAPPAPRTSPPAPQPEKKPAS